MIILKKKITFLFILALSCLGCKHETKQNKEIEIEYLKSSFYLKESKGSDAELPPILKMKFSVENFTNSKKVLPIKSSQFDNQKSKMFIIDTIHNKILPLYSDDVVILEPNSTQYFICNVKLRKENVFFGLDVKTLKPRMDVDYSIHKKYFEEKCNFVIKNSVIVYIHDSTDVNYYMRENKNITGLKNSTMISITK